MIIQNDFLEVYQLLKEDNNTMMHVRSLQTNIKRLMRNNLETRVIHIYREVNKCADALTKLRASSVQDLSLFIECPQDVYAYYVENHVGTSYMWSVIV